MPNHSPVHVHSSPILLFLHGIQVLTKQALIPTTTSSFTMKQQQQQSLIFLLLLAASSTRLSHAVCENGRLRANCAAGCWNPGGHIESNGDRLCVAVQAGYYSLANSNDRQECEAGHVSLLPEAERCDACQPGTFASPLHDSCIACPRGSYQDLAGGSVCFGCNPLLYNGLGSTSRSIDGYCLRQSESPSAAPSTLPTLAPSPVPSTQPSQLPSTPPSLAPSSQPSLSPSMLPSESPSSFPSQGPTFLVNETISSPLVESERVCDDDEYDFHGKCDQCPNIAKSIAFPVAAVVIAVLLAGYYHLQAPQGTPNVFLLFEYTQNLHLIGTTHAPWPAVMKWLFQACGIFAVDLNVLLPLECLGFSPQLCKVFILSMPVDVLIMGKALIKSWTLFRGTGSRIPIERLIGAFIVGVNICYMTLVRTALEAAQCSPAQSSDQDEDTFEVDWMCIKNGSALDKFAAWFGLFAGIMYGILYPIAFWLLIKRNKESAQNERSYSNDDATAVSADPEAQQGTRAHTPDVDTDPKPIKQVIRPFIATYTDQKSSWCLCLLAHKLISVVSVTLGGDIVVLSQALLIVYQASIGIFTLVESPYWLDFDGDSETENESSRPVFLRPFQRLDFVLRLILVEVLAVGITLTSLADPEVRVVLGFIGLVPLVAGFLYIAYMVVCTYFDRESKETATKQTLRVRNAPGTGGTGQIDDSENTDGALLQQQSVGGRALHQAKEDVCEKKHPVIARVVSEKIVYAEATVVETV